MTKISNYLKKYILIPGFSVFLRNYSFKISRLFCKTTPLPKKISLSLYLSAFLFAILFFFNCSPGIKKPPKAIKGVLDLSNWEFDSSIPSAKILNLDGEWEFYWQEFPTIDSTGEPFLPSERTEYIQVPMDWNGYSHKDISTQNEIIIGGKGYATYRLKIVLHSLIPLSIRVPHMGTAYKLYINNKSFAEGGTVGTTEQSSIPFWGKKYISFTPDKQDFIITLQISNFHNTNGGFWQSMMIAGTDELNTYRLNRLALDLFVIGILFIMGVYHLSLYFLRREDPSALYFGMLSLLISIRTCVTGEIYLKIFYSDFNYASGITINYITFYLTLPLFNEFISTLYHSETNKYIRIFIRVSCIGLSAIVLLLSPYYFSSTLLYYEIILLIFLFYAVKVFIVAVLNQREGAEIILIGFSIFGITCINDMLHDSNIINTGFYSSYGLVIFIFSQAFLLTSRFANAFHQVKDLSENLEKKVESRTKDLEKQKQQIQKAFQELQDTQAQLIEAERMASLGQLVGGIAHEINNPIAAIRSHAEILKKNNQTAINEIPQFLDSLAIREKNLFFQLVNTSLNQKEFLTTREERKIRKDYLNNLKSIIKDEDLCGTFVDHLVTIRLPPPYDSYFGALGENNFLRFLSYAEVFKSQSNSISSIEISVEKSSRVIFALRSYLNTQLHSDKREVDLVLELEKALHVYDNYVVGKIDIKKEYPIELPYFCNSENLLQVWKNIIFNSIQATYQTDKNLEIKLERLDSLPQFLKTYKTSSMIEDSLFQKKVNNWIVVRFTDSGEGIPVNLQQKVFTPFFTTKSTGEGIGLGLYTCKKIVHEHGGALFFKSEKGNTEVVVVLES